MRRTGRRDLCESIGQRTSSFNRRNERHPFCTAIGHQRGTRRSDGRDFNGSFERIRVIKLYFLKFLNFFIKKTKKYLIIENKYYIMSLDKDVKGRCALNCTFSLTSSFLQTSRLRAELVFCLQKQRVLL